RMRLATASSWRSAAIGSAIDVLSADVGMSRVIQGTLSRRSFPYGGIGFVPRLTMSVIRNAPARLQGAGATCWHSLGALPIHPLQSATTSVRSSVLTLLNWACHNTARTVERRPSQG